MSHVSPVTTPASDPSAIKYSKLRIIRFRVRQALAWWARTFFKVPLAQLLVGWGLLLRGMRLRKPGLKYLLLGRRAANVGRADVAIRQVIEQDRTGRGELIGLLSATPQRPLTDYADRILMLKVPRIENCLVVEKGAVIVKFSETFAPLFQGLNVRRLAKYFRIILEPSWVGYSSADLLIWTQLGEEKVIVLAPYQPDYDLLETLNSNLVPISLGPADWVDPTCFTKLDDVKKLYDAIYVANYNPLKRVDRYLRAVVRISRARPGFRAALVCAGLGKKGRFGRHIQDTIAWARSRADLDFFNGVTQQRLNELFNQSRANVLVSLREGANKCLAEGLFSGTPALLIAESACGNHLHMNSETGCVVSDHRLEQGLCWLAEHYADYRPREWAERNISPRASTDKLSRFLQELEAAEGRRWIMDLSPKINHPELDYLNAEDAWLLGERANLLEVFSKANRVGNVDDYLHGLTVKALH